MLPLAGHPNLPDDHLSIVCQPDMRFFEDDCHVRDHFPTAKWIAPEPPGPPDSKEIFQQPTEGWEAENPNFMLPDKNGVPSPYADPHADCIRLNREGFTAGGEGPEMTSPTPELLDLMRIRLAARNWTEHNPQGQAEFIWICHNTHSVSQIPEGQDPHFLQGYCTPDEYKAYQKRKWKDGRANAVHCGDIMIMMTARFARRMMAVIAPTSVVLTNMMYCLLTSDQFHFFENT